MLRSYSNMCIDSFLILKIYFDVQFEASLKRLKSLDNLSDELPAITHVSLNNLELLIVRLLEIIIYVIFSSKCIQNSMLGYCTSMITYELSELVNVSTIFLCPRLA